ncbi:MAG TPA: porin [Gemmatimonadaceae bacterium]
MHLFVERCRYVHALIVGPLVGVLVTMLVAAPLAAQYPLAPTSVLDVGHLTAAPSFGAYLAARQTVQQDTATFTISRARVKVEALPMPSLALRVEGGMSNNTVGTGSGSSGSFEFADVFAQFAPVDGRMVRMLRPALIVGQFKMPFSLEYLTGYSHLLTIERSQAVDQLSIKRDIGAMGQVHLTRFLTVNAAVANGSGANATNNTNGRESAMARVTLTPLPQLELSGKVADDGADHRWGYDARVIAGAAIVEGEVVHRTHDVDAGTSDATGGYALAAYKVRAWLQPVVKWEQLHETTPVASSPGSPVVPPAMLDARSTWTTVGVNIDAPLDRLRLQLDWIVKSAHPVDQPDELLAQFVAVF